jgi:hypothetical protein
MYSSVEAKNRSRNLDSELFFLLMLKRDAYPFLFSFSLLLIWEKAGKHSFLMKCILALIFLDEFRTEIWIGDRKLCQDRITLPSRNPHLGPCDPPNSRSLGWTFQASNNDKTIAKVYPQIFKCANTLRSVRVYFPQVRYCAQIGHSGFWFLIKNRQISLVQGLNTGYITPAAFPENDSWGAHCWYYIGASHWRHVTAFRSRFWTTWKFSQRMNWFLNLLNGNPSFPVSPLACALSLWLWHLLCPVCLLQNLLEGEPESDENRHVYWELWG